MCVCWLPSRFFSSASSPCSRLQTHLSSVCVLLLSSATGSVTILSSLVMMLCGSLPGFPSSAYCVALCCFVIDSLCDMFWGAAQNFQPRRETVFVAVVAERHCGRDAALTRRAARLHGGDAGPPPPGLKALVRQTISLASSSSVSSVLFY